MKKSIIVLAGLSLVALTGTIAATIKTNKVINAEIGSYSVTLDKNSIIDGNKLIAKTAEGHDIEFNILGRFVKNDVNTLGDLSDSEAWGQIKNTNPINGIRSLDIDYTGDQLYYQYSSYKNISSALTEVAENGFHTEFATDEEYAAMERASVEKGINFLSFYTKTGGTSRINSITITFDCRDRLGGVTEKH